MTVQVAVKCGCSIEVEDVLRAVCLICSYCKQHCVCEKPLQLTTEPPAVAFLRLPAERIVPVKEKQYHPHRPTPTQLQSWRQKQESGLGEEQRRVYAAYAAHPEGLTRMQAAEITHLPINVICARVNELLKLGLLFDAGKRVINPASGKWVEVLKVQDEPQQSLEQFAEGS